MSDRYTILGLLNIRFKDEHSWRQTGTLKTASAGSEADGGALALNGGNTDNDASVALNGGDTHSGCSTAIGPQCLNSP